MEAARFHFDKHSCLECNGIILYQIGDLSCGYKQTVERHDQLCYELSLIMSGSADFYIDDEPVPVRAGDIVLNLPGDVHTIKSGNSDPVRYLYIGFDFLNRDISKYPFAKIRADFDNAPLRVVKDKYEMWDLFFSVFNEINSEKQFNNHLISNYVTEIVIKSHRSFFDSGQKPLYNPKIPNIKADDTIYNIINRLDSENLRIERRSQIGNDYGYSYAYLSNLFSKKVGVTFSEYFYKRLFERAVNLLQSGNSVTETAEKLGYNSIHTFSRAFTRHYGVPPSKYPLNK